MNILNKWKFSILAFVYFFVAYNTDFIVDEMWKLWTFIIFTVIVVGASAYEVANNLIKKAN